MKVREILRPARVTQRIFGEDHDLRRLSLGDILELVGLIDPETLKGGDPLVILENGGKALGFILEKSFPSFDGWDEFPKDQLPYILELIWDSNDISGLIANFTQAAERMKGKLSDLNASIKG
nr:hypothetical protein [uncultured Dethiosulfovibrio sp.]